MGSVTIYNMNILGIQCSELYPTLVCQALDTTVPTSHSPESLLPLGRLNSSERISGIVFIGHSLRSLFLYTPHKEIIRFLSFSLTSFILTPSHSIQVVTECKISSLVIAEYIPQLLYSLIVLKNTFFPSGPGYCQYQYNK